MIEKVIDEILAAELNAQNIVKEAGEKAAEIRAAAAKDAEVLKNNRSEEFLKAAALKRAEAEKAGRAEADRLLVKARGEAEAIKADAAAKIPQVVNLIIEEMFGGI